MHLVLVPLLLAVGWTEGSFSTWTVSHLEEKNSAEHMHAEAVASLPLSFRLGSGADYNEPNTQTAQTAQNDLELKPGHQAPPEAEPQGGRDAAHPLPLSRLRQAFLYFGRIAALITLLMMMPTTGGSRYFNYRITPAWSPEHDNTYSFRAYLTDISIWIMLTDLQPHQQCAAIVMRPGGAAREMARMISRTK